MITSINISVPFKLEEHHNYFTLVLSSDFITFEDCIKSCTELTNGSEYGMTLLIVTKWSEIMDLPTHKTIYVWDKGESETLTLDWERCVNADIRHEVNFGNDWIEKYNVHQNHRLSFIYKEDCTIEESKLISNMYETQTKPPEFKIKELKLC